MTSVLNPFLYFRRSLGRTLPMVFVIMLAVILVASVVTVVRSIDLTILTLYGYNRNLTAMTPRNGIMIEDSVVEKVRKLPELGKLYPVHSYQTSVKTTFGKMIFPVFGLDPEGRALILARTGVSLAAGHLPKEGAPEAVLSDTVAKNLDLKVGDTLFAPGSEDSYAPIPIKLVGLLHGPVWLGLTSKSLVDFYSPWTFTGYLAFAPDVGQRPQRRLDAAVDRIVDKAEARVWTLAILLRETRSALANLYLILSLIVSIIVFAISFVCGLLANIYFTQRLPEIATLSAIGYSRGQLLRRSLGDTALLCLVGWLLGVVVTIGLLESLLHFVLAPRGLLLNPVDWAAFRFTLPLPITIILFALITISLRLNSLDPVSIIERRG